MHQVSGIVCALVAMVGFAACSTAAPAPEESSAPDPAPLAAASGEACGNVTCEAGAVCCNESCGICTPPDGLCTKQYCLPVGEDGARRPAGDGPEDDDCIARVGDDSHGGDSDDACRDGDDDGDDEGEVTGGTPCGPNTCAAGLECCNASCGLCVSPGGFCTQQACAQAI